MAKARVKALLSRSEVARLFHVSPITIGRWADQGKLPYELTLGGQRRYPREGTLAILGEVARRAQEVRRSQRPRTRVRRAPSGATQSGEDETMDRMGEVSGRDRPRHRLTRSGAAPGAAYEGGDQR